MPSFTQTFDFSLCDKVSIIEIDRPGIVTGISIDSTGVTYRVVYWHEGTRRESWVFGWEIKLKDSTNT